MDFLVKTSRAKNTQFTFVFVPILRVPVGKEHLLTICLLLPAKSFETLEAEWVRGLLRAMEAEWVRGLLRALENMLALVKGS